MESKASTSPSHSNSTRQNQYYLAVDRVQFKMGTLMDALHMARRPSLPIVLCCNTRDELEYVYSVVSKMSNISCTALHSDLAAAERASILEKFRQAVINWRKAAGGEEIEGGEEARKCRVMVVTDVCLPLLGAGESPIGAHILINYELPAKKDMYMRRMATCLAADGVVINMVAGGGEVVSLRNIEVSCGIVIPEMPINMWLTLSQQKSTTLVIN